MQESLFGVQGFALGKCFTAGNASLPPSCSGDSRNKSTCAVGIALQGDTGGFCCVVFPCDVPWESRNLSRVPGRTWGFLARWLCVTVMFLVCVEEVLFSRNI